MNDKDRELIQQVLHAAGTTGERGFEYLAHYTAIGGIIGIIGFLLLLTFSAYVFKKLMSWQPEDDDGFIPRGAGLVITSLAVIIFVFGFIDSVQNLLAPEGAAIHSMLHKS